VLEKCADAALLQGILAFLSDVRQAGIVESI
jgi:hypothetical protein